MTADDSKRIVQKALELTYAEWERTGAPVKPGTPQAEILIVEAANAALREVIAEKRAKIQ